MKLWDVMESLLENGKQGVSSVEVEDIEKIPLETDMSLEVNRWYRIRNVVSIYVDMQGSTQLTNEKYIRTSAKMYEIFTGSLIRIFKEFGAQFIDIKGDGGFALFKERFGSVKAFLAGVTFKTYVEKHLKSFVKSQISDWEIASKIGIEKGTILVKRVGTRNQGDNKYNWAIWAGKPVNISAKLSDLAEADTILASDGVFQDLSHPKELEKYLILSCGCPDGVPKNLWEQRTIADSVDSVWELRSKWCDDHGEEYINKILDVIVKKEY